MSWRFVILLLLVPFLVGSDTGAVRDDAKDWADFLEEWLYGTVSETEEDGLARIDDLQDRFFTMQAAAHAATIHFASGSASLDAEAEDTLREFAHVAARAPAMRFHLSGHADAVPIRGAYRSNAELSLARARHARRFLIAEGIAADRLTAAGYGDRYPVGSNTEADGRAANRRVEVHVVPAALSVPSPPAAPRPRGRASSWRRRHRASG